MNAKSYFILALLMLFVGACHSLPQPPEIETPTATQSPIPPEPIASLTASRTPHPTNTPRSTLTPSPTSELFDCLPPTEDVPPPAASIQILYVNENKVWLWDENSRQKTAVELPADAVGPHLSPDGRYIAFLTKGKEVSLSNKPLEGIPLRIFDRVTNTFLEAGEFSPRTTHDLYPLAERVYLQLVWQTSPQKTDFVEGLEVNVFAEPWGLGTESMVGERYRVSLPEGEISLLEETPAPKGIPSPDGRFEIADHPQGLRMFDHQSRQEQIISLELACPDPEVCYLTGERSIVWRLDSSGFYTTSTRNAFFDERAETTLYFVQVTPQVMVEERTVIRANPWTFSYSPDRRFLAFWNQPDVDNAPPKTYNWVTLSLMDLQTLQVRRYTQGWALRLAGWSPDSRRFLLVSSPFGGPNPIVRRLVIGDICRPPEELSVPPKQAIMETLWLDTRRVLMWTAPEEGIPDRYLAGMYFYDLSRGSEPIRIDELVQDYFQPYGLRHEFVILK
ncbi:MAG: hypothetical protein ACK4SN_12470 [Bellilinea sp.]